MTKLLITLFLYGIIYILFLVLNLGDGLEGDWSYWEYCSDHAYVSGFAIKSYDTNCWDDCAGATDIKLICVDADIFFPK